MRWDPWMATGWAMRSPLQVARDDVRTYRQQMTALRTQMDACERGLKAAQERMEKLEATPQSVE
jgi:hypothetical protein